MRGRKPRATLEAPGLWLCPCGKTGSGVIGYSAAGNQWSIQNCELVGTKPWTDTQGSALMLFAHVICKACRREFDEDWYGVRST